MVWLLRLVEVKPQPVKDRNTRGVVTAFTE
jgi:hypothetical protein